MCTMTPAPEPRPVTGETPDVGLGEREFINEAGSILRERGVVVRDSDLGRVYDRLAAALAAHARDHAALRERAEVAEAKVAAVLEIAGDMWRVAPCGCGHRADLHVGGTMAAAVCTGGLGLCGCDWSFTRIIQTRLRAALADRPAGGESDG